MEFSRQEYWSGLVPKWKKYALYNYVHSHVYLYLYLACIIICRCVSLYVLYKSVI